MSQKEFVLKVLQSGKTITPAKAQAECNIWRLADVILKLRKAGYNIITKLNKSISGKTYAEYRLEA
jgi:hypothetical protein